MINILTLLSGAPVVALPRPSQKCADFGFRSTCVVVPPFWAPWTSSWKALYAHFVATGHRGHVDFFTMHNRPRCVNERDINIHQLYIYIYIYTCTWHIRTFGRVKHCACMHCVHVFVRFHSVECNEWIHICLVDSPDHGTSYDNPLPRWLSLKMNRFSIKPGFPVIRILKGKWTVVICPSNR